MKTIQEYWETYAHIAIPKDASKIQIRATKRAFYNGVGTLFQLQIDIPRGITVKAECEMLDGWSNEVLQFKKDVEDGRA